MGHHTPVDQRNTFKMKLSALIATVAAQYNPDPTEPAPVPTDPPAPAPVPVETFACFPGNEITPCGCQWNTLESLANKTCTVSFDNDGSVLQFQSHGTWTEGDDHLATLFSTELTV